MTNWKKYKLSDITEIIGGGTPRTSNSEYWNGNIPWLSVVDFAGDRKKVYSTEKSITEKGLIESSAKLLKKGQLIISARGTVGELAMLGCDMAFNQSCYGLNSKHNLTQNDFLYYLIKYEIESVKAITHGSVFDTITRQTFEQIEVVIPDLPTQTRIASILSALDDKIELNRRMNATLEQMAATLFKKYFVDDIDPDNLPEGWRWGKLGDVANFYNGYAFSSKELLKEENSNCFHVFKMGHIKKGGGLNSDGTKSFFDKSKSEGLARYILKKGDLLMCMTDMKDSMALLGHTALMNEDDKYIVNQRVGLIRTNGKYDIGYPFLYLLTNSAFFIEDLRNRANSGVQVNLSTSEIKNSEIIIPATSVNKNFNETVMPMFDKMFSIVQENQKLIITRDTLLPKLMSGELDISALTQPFDKLRVSNANNYAEALS